MPTAILADDHEIVRHGIRALLTSVRDLKIVAEAGDGVEAVRLIGQQRPDVVITDVAMPGLNGIDVTEHVRRVSPRTSVVIYSMHVSESYVARAFRNGAAAYVSKAADAVEVVRAVEAVLRGKRYLGATLSERAVDHYLESLVTGPDDAWETLTPREREVLQLAAEGLSNADIGKRLFVSPRTVESHRASVLRKLALRGQTDLVIYAVRRGLLPVDDTT